MDYFEGILFLTTNRVGHFDEAFMSRIHVSIGYERLDDKAREQIWDNLFAKLKEDKKNGGPEVRYEYEAKQYAKKDGDVKRLEWNGREIRNGVSLFEFRPTSRSWLTLVVKLSKRLFLLLPSTRELPRRRAGAMRMLFPRSRRATSARS